MSRRDYIKIAAVIAEATTTAEGTLDVDKPYDDTEYVAKEPLLKALAELFAEDNSGFDAARFEAACRGEV